MAELEHKELWLDYWNSTDPGPAMVRLIDAWMPLVHSVLDRISIRLPSHVPLEDLLQCGAIGLYCAVERFAPERNVSFPAFARVRIRGAILDQLRADDHMSRSGRTGFRKVQKAMEAFTNSFGRPPSTEELAGETGLTPKALDRILDRARPWISLDSSVMFSDSGDPVPLREVVADRETPSPVEDIDKREMRTYLRKAFRGLTTREQKVLYLYYFENLRLREIAALFELTDARICQIHSLAIMKLQAVLSAYNEDELRAAG